MKNFKQLNYIKFHSINSLTLKRISRQFEIYMNINQLNKIFPKYRAIFHKEIKCER